MTVRFDTRLSDQALAAIASARRAAAAQRAASASVSVEVRPLASLRNMIEPWTALAARTIEPNVFLEPAFALAAAPALGADVKAGLIWSQGAQPELLGLFPVRVAPRRYGLPLPVLCSWTHSYAPIGTPLVHRAAPQLVVAAWLDHLRQESSQPSLLLMPYVRDDGPFAAALDAELARRGQAAARYDGHQRALLAPGGGRTDYLARAVARKRRKELARQWRRMQDLGALTVAHSDGPEAVARALEDFLRLEAAGWKGRAGTAAAADPEIKQFVTHAVVGLSAQRQASLYRLCIGRTAIAAAIVLSRGQSAWCWKIAYDEGYARYSPGAQLLVRLTDGLLHDERIVQANSLATPDHPLIDHIWRERCAISDRLIPLRNDSFVPFSVVCRLEAMRRLGRSAARMLRDHLRGR